MAVIYPQGLISIYPGETVIVKDPGDFSVETFPFLPPVDVLDAVIVGEASLDGVLNKITVDPLANPVLTDNVPHNIIKIGLGAFSIPQQSTISGVAVLDAGFVIGEAESQVSSGFQTIIPIGFEGVSFSDEINFGFSNTLDTIEIETLSFLSSGATVQAEGVSVIDLGSVVVVEDLIFLDLTVGAVVDPVHTFMQTTVGTVAGTEITTFENSLEFEIFAGLSFFDNTLATIQSEAVTSFENEVSVAAEDFIMLDVASNVVREKISTISFSTASVAATRTSFMRSGAYVAQEGMSFLESGVGQVVFSGFLFMDSGANVAAEKRLLLRNELIFPSTAISTFRNRVNVARGSEIILNCEVAIVEQATQHIQLLNTAIIKSRPDNETFVIHDTYLYGSEFDVGVLDDPLYKEYVFGAV